MVTIPPDWLQYGAFGLLVVILYFVGRWLKDRLAADREAQVAREHKHEERLDKQQDFMEELLEKDRALLDQEKTALKEMVETDIATRREVVTSMQTINETMQRTCDTADARHIEIMATLRAREVGSPQ